MIVTPNKKVACSVPENTGRTMNKSSGFSTVDHQDGGLMKLMVVFGTKDIQAGAAVYLAEQDKQQPWAAVKFKLQDREFVLVPEDRILLIEEVVRTTTPRPDYRDQPIGG